MVQAIARICAGLVGGSRADGCLSLLVGGRMSESDFKLDRFKDEITISERGQT